MFNPSERVPFICARRAEDLGRRQKISRFPLRVRLGSSGHVRCTSASPL